MYVNTAPPLKIGGRHGVRYQQCLVSHKIHRNSQLCLPFKSPRTYHAFWMRAINKRLQRSFSFRANWMRTHDFVCAPKNLNRIRRPPFVRARGQTIPIIYARRKSFGRSYLKCINDMILFTLCIKRILGDASSFQRGSNILQFDKNIIINMCFILYDWAYVRWV